MRLSLDALEAKGLRLIADRARSDALTRAAAWAAPASVVGGAGLALSALFVPPTLVSVLAALGLPPLAAVCWVFFRARRVQAAERSAVLAQLDHRYGIKDRIQTSDEFARLSRRSPFQDAALQEASPWLDRAATASVAAEATLRLGRSRAWLWPLLALSLAALAFVVPQLHSAASNAATERSTTASIGAPLVDGTTSSEEALSRRSAEPVRPLGAPSRTEGRPGQGAQGSGLSTGLHRLAALLSPDRASAGGPRDAGRPGAAGETAAGGGDSAGRGPQGSAGRGGSRGASAGEPQSDRPNADRSAPGGEAGAEDQSDMASAPASGGQSAGGRQAAPSARQAAPQRSSAENSQSGEGQASSPRSRRGDQSQQGGEQSGGQGESGRQSGEDAGAKKGRGVSSLLLATPVQDRLAGMASPGRTSTTTRDGAPQAFPVTPGQAGDRGVARGEAGRTAPRAVSPQDQRLTRDYFTRRNAGGR